MKTLTTFLLLAGLCSAQVTYIPVSYPSNGTNTKPVVDGFNLVGAGSLSFTAGGTNENITFTPSGTGAVVIPSSVTSGLQLYNTADQVTNYERLEALWSGNAPVIRSVNAGTGSPRGLIISGSNGVNTLTLRGSGISSLGVIGFTAYSTSAAGVGFGFNGFSSTATSGSVTALSITPTYNQSSGTAANTDLLVNRTETAVGSGTQRLIDAQVGGITQFNIGNTGNEYLLGTAHRWAGYGAGTLTTDGSGNITATSDARRKDIEGNYTKGLAEIVKLSPKLWRWKADSGLDTADLNAGLIAQDVLAAGISEAVGTHRTVYVMEDAVEQATDNNGLPVERTVRRNKLNPDGKPMKQRVEQDFYTVNDRAIIAALVNAVKELKTKNDALEARIATLEGK